jgi:hypothetical protein
MSFQTVYIVLQMSGEVMVFVNECRNQSAEWSSTSTKTNAEQRK